MLDAVRVAGRWISKPLLGKPPGELEQLQLDCPVGLRLEDRNNTQVAAIQWQDT